MTTLLLADKFDSTVITARPCRASDRLLAYTRNWQLTEELADGADPDCSAPRLLVAASLMRRRRRLAKVLRRALAQAEGSRRPFDGTIPVAAQEIQLARDLLEEMAEQLEASEPVDVRGVALIRLLVADGSRPLYASGRPEALRRYLQDALDCLLLTATDHAET